MKVFRSLLIIFIIFLLCGCQEKDTSLVHEHCVRFGNAGNDAEVQLNYDIYYTGDILKKIESFEKIISEDQTTLDLYESAYKSIHSDYEGIEYFTTKLDRDEVSVSSTMIIEYDKVDISKIVEIEGEEDNIFDDDIAFVSKWKEFAEKVGVTCEVVK